MEWRSTSKGESGSPSTKAGSFAATPPTERCWMPADFPSGRACGRHSAARPRAPVPYVGLDRTWRTGTPRAAACRVAVGGGTWRAGPAVRPVPGIMLLGGVAAIDDRFGDAIMKLDSSLARNSTAFAISSARANRPIGCICMTAVKAACGSACLASTLLNHIGFHIAGMNRIYPDSVAFFSQCSAARSRQCGNGGPRGVIGDGCRIASECADRGDVDDPAPFARICAIPACVPAGRHRD